VSDDHAPSLRASSVERLEGTTFDALVLGGGINGAVSAAALAARGARVALIDRNDFASATSQESSCLIWGGIKYLETMEVGLVRRLCQARNRLVRAYPSAVREIRFFTSHTRGFRHGRWKLLAGAWLYWLLGSGFTRRPRPLGLAAMRREEPVIALEGLDGGFEYSDAWLPDGDARFVWGFVRAAMDQGCVAANYVESLSSVRQGDEWVTSARDLVTGRSLHLRSRLLVNACGPWADGVNARDGVTTGQRHVLSKGIHLVVERLTPGGRVLAFFADDGRLFFVIPFGSKTCIGTTDTPVDRPEVGVTAEDRRFVLDNINKRLRLPRPLVDTDVFAERCGVRPLVVEAGGDGGRDWMQLSRRHAIAANRDQRHITIFGGKLTDCLNVGEEICDEARRCGLTLPSPERRWFGEPSAAHRDEFLAEARSLGLDASARPGEAEPASTRLWRRYGKDAPALLEAIRRDPRAAEPVLEGCDTLRCEVVLAARLEMVVDLEDFLRRRTGIAQVVRRDVLRRDPGMVEICQILFGAAAESRWAAYFEAT
jgi:glycerol-3-phosphate dehydrogenase